MKAAARAVISSWPSSRESVAPTEGDKMQAPREADLSIELSPSPATEGRICFIFSVHVCATAKFRMDARPAPDSLETRPLTFRMSLQTLDLHNGVCGSGFQNVAESIHLALVRGQRSSGKTSQTM